MLRFGGTALRLVQFLVSIAILAIFSYILALQSRNGIEIPTWVRAVEGLSGAAALYTLFGVLLTCFLGGIAAFGYVAMFLDVCFVGAMIAIAIETRQGNRDCNALANEEPLGFGPNGLGDPDTQNATPNTYNACTILKATWILAIIGAILFLLTIPYQFLIVQHHRKEKQTNPHAKYGFFGRRGQKNPPNTPVVASQKRGFWRRREAKGVAADAETGNGYTNGDTYTNGNGYTNGHTNGNGYTNGHDKYATNSAVNY